MDKKDLYIKAKLQEDKKISNQANEIFKNFEGGIKLENNNKQKERKVIKISFNQAILAFTSLMIVFILGGNLYAHINGKPNLYSAIKGLFVKEDKYAASEIIVDKTVESNGIKLTLKTVAMDENVLITKYVAEGEKLANEFYTYAELEETAIKISKITFSQLGYDIGEKEYENYTMLDIGKMQREVLEKLQATGISEEDAKNIATLAFNAYKEYIGAQIDSETYSDKKAKELIAETIAMFESKVSSKYEIMTSMDTLQNFNIEVVSQKIEKSGNQYIIYNVYNVDTISDLASKFDLNIKIEQIGSTKGTWNFSTELEKARLDTRVETIDFYNTETNVYGNEEDGYIKVGIKRLVISDFSSVLMLQKDSEYYNDNSTESLLKNTYTYVVTDESGNILGTGGTKKEELVYADRIILENVNMNTKILKVNVYSNINNELLKTITVDIEKARTEKHIELNQSLYNESHGIALNYPGDWKQVEKQSVNQGVELYSTEDIDGNVTWIFIERMLLNDIENGKIILGDPDEFKDVIKTSIEVSGYTGNDYVYTYAENIKERQIRVVKDDVMYFIRYRGNLTQFERYYETFEEILKTVSFVEVEPEKSYRAFSEGGLEVIKLYEDNTLTISFSEDSIESINHEAKFDFRSNTEYEIIGVLKHLNPSYVEIKTLYLYDSHKDIPMIYVITDGDLYYVDIKTAQETGKFEIVAEPILKNIKRNVSLASDKMYEYYRNKGEELGSKILHQVETIDGRKYILNYNYNGEILVEEYKEKSYRTFSNGLYETVKVYEDNTITISFAKERVEIFKEMQKAEGAASLKPYEEYNISGVNGLVREVKILETRQDFYELPMIWIIGSDKGLYCIDIDTFYKTGELKTIEINEFKNVIVDTVENKFTNNDAWAYFVATWYDGPMGLQEITTVNGETYGIYVSTLEVRKYEKQQSLTDVLAKQYIEKFFQEEVYTVKDTPNGTKYQVVDIKFNGMSDEYYYYEVDLYIINGENTEKTTWGFELLNSNGNIVRRNIVTP